MNLENLNVQELSLEEQVNTDGGGFGPFMMGLRFALSTLNYSEPGNYVL